MSISYVDSVATLPRPTIQQVAEFVEYVAAAHSWYKHLPVLPPGLPFVFYLDPNAGREWIEDGSRSGFRDRLANAPARERFHYTWQPTSEYVARFGYLMYFAKAGTSFCVPMKGGVLNTAAAPRVQVEDRRWMLVTRSWITLPEDVRREGTVYLTAVIHPHAQRYMTLCLGEDRGGTYLTTHRDIFAYDDSTADEITRTAVGLLRRVLRDPGQGDGSLMPSLPASLSDHEELQSRVLPAWAKIQKEQMSQAIHRMLDYIYAGRVSQPAV